MSDLREVDLFLVAQWQLEAVQPGLAQELLGRRLLERERFLSLLRPTGPSTAPASARRRAWGTSTSSMSPRFGGRCAPGRRVRERARVHIRNAGVRCAGEGAGREPQLGDPGRRAQSVPPAVEQCTVGTTGEFVVPAPAPGLEEQKGWALVCRRVDRQTD